MDVSKRWIVILAACALVCTSAPIAAGGGIGGHWKLVEQTYGGGGQNLAPRGDGVHLDIGKGVREGQVSTWLDVAPDDVRPWPALFVRDAPASLEVRSRVIDTRAGEMTAAYRVDSREPGGLVLEIVESYALDGDGAFLVGQVTIEMYRDGERRGGYELHRRFERAP